tara:strand:+ start:496 stop:981 length:486 start_codon:yes stop_codon:yes gene_type:complete
MDSPGYTSESDSTALIKPHTTSTATRYFQLNGTGNAGNGTDTKKFYVYFRNRIFYGFTTDSEFDNSNEVKTMSGGTVVKNNITNTKNYTSVTFNCTSNHYVWICYPKRLGTSQIGQVGFTVGGFESPDTVSVTTDNGYTEDYYCYRSSNSFNNTMQFWITD